MAVHGDAEVATLDFRRPNLISREDTRALEVAHELFTRRLSTLWGQQARAVLQPELLAIDQLRYDDYLRSMPTPNVLLTVSLPPLPGQAIVELNGQLALGFVDRLLGGTGVRSAQDEAPRRPTELESVLVRDLLGQAADALAEALRPLVDDAAPVALDYSAQHVQIAGPSDMVIVLTYRLGVTQGLEDQGLLSVCYPAITLRPVLEHLAQSAQGGARDDALDQPTARAAVHDRLQGVGVDFAVCLTDSVVAACDLDGLAVGDVLRLDHRVGQPVVGRVGQADVLRGHLGRRGRRLALQVTGWTVPEPAPVRATGVPPAPDETDPLPETVRNTP